MEGKESVAASYFEGIKKYLTFLINRFNNNIINVPDESELISAKVAILGNIFLSVKESLVENTGNLHFESKLFNDYLEKDVKMIAKKTVNGYVIDGYTFLDAGTMVATIRNKLAHGKYLIDYENNTVLISHDGRMFGIDIDKLAKMVVLGVQNVIAVSKKTEVSRCLCYSDRMQQNRIKKLTKKSDIKGLIRSFKNLKLTIKSNYNVIDEETLLMFKLLRDNFGNMEYRDRLMKAFEKGIKNNNYTLIKSEQKISEQEIEDFLDLVMTRDNDSIKTYEEQYKLIAVLLQKKLESSYNKIHPIISNLNNLFLIDYLKNNYDASMFFNNNITYIQNYGVNEIAMALVALFNALFIYGYDDLYENENIYQIDDCLGLDYSLIDTSKFVNVMYKFDGGPIDNFLEQEAALIKNKNKHEEMLEKNKVSLIAVTKNNNLQAINIIKNNIKTLEEQINNEKIEINNITKRVKIITDYCQNNALYLKNKAYIEGIRNAIAHGNYEIIENSTLNNSKIIFRDIYEGELTFMAEISIQDFIDFLDSSRIVVSNYLQNKIENKITR